MFYHPEAAGFCKHCEHRIVRHTSKIHCTLCVFRENMKAPQEINLSGRIFPSADWFPTVLSHCRARRRALLSVKPSCGCLLHIRIEAVRHFQQLRKMRQVVVSIVFRCGVSHSCGFHASGVGCIHAGNCVFNNQALLRFQP